MCKICRLSVLAFFLFFLATNLSAKEFNIIDFGARPGHEGLNTEAIQAAIDAASEAKGTVIIPKGVYPTGTLFLKSNLTIKMESGAEIYGSKDLKDYAEIPVATEEPHFSKSLFYAHKQENITIIGHPRTEINGRGYFFKHSPERPKLFRIEHCKNIEFDNVIVKNSGSWCMYFRECDSINIHHTSVYNKENRNNDGMNYDGCSNVRIEDCNLQVEDDAICLKSSVDKLCENIVVTNCTVSSYWACVKFGTASKTGFKNVKVRDCQFFDSRHGCIKLLAVDGAILEDVLFENIKIYNCGGPIFLRLGNRGRDYSESIKQVYEADVKPEGRPVGQIKNITFRNIEGRLTGRIDPPTECIMFTGLPGHYIENVTLENVHFSYTGFGDLNVKDRVVLEDEARYPEQLFFGVLPSYGLFLRHVKGLNMKNVSLELRNHDDRHAMVMKDVVQSKVEDLNFDISSEAGSAMVLKNVAHTELSNIQSHGALGTLVEVRGESSAQIVLRGSNDPESVVFTDKASKESLICK